MYNSQEQMILGGLVIVYFLFLFGVSLYINQRSIKTYDDYNVAGRSVSIFPLILTFVGTAVGGSTLLGYMENGYSFGMGQHWLNFGTLFAGIILMFFFVKKIRQYGEKYDMVTIADFTTLRFGEGARFPTVISILIAYSAITGMQFVAIATILNLTIGMSITTGIIISWVMLTLKTYFGGMKSVIWQDAFHGTIQTIGIFTLFVVVIIASGGWGNITENALAMNEGANLSIFSISSTQVFVYLLTIGAYQFVRQDLWQRFWAAKDIKTASRGYWISIILAFLTGFFVITIGVAGKYGLQMGEINPTLSYYEIIGNVFNFPMVVVMIIALLATVISTADSFFMAGASSIVNDIIKPRLKSQDDKKLLFYSRVSVMLVSIFSILLALYIPQLVNLWVTGTAMLVSSLLAPVIFGLFWKGTTKAGGTWAMWIGLIIAVVWQMAGHPFGIHPVFIGLPISTVLVIVISLLTKSNGVNVHHEEEAI
ncbi:sodium:proline symporter [Siminovitchia terrae]|uniref:Sodium:solute symporter family protein n=1 Tax=Siminovitchia terrae TaxID=1914933 RepID=A0A429X238_SIMTE|nr:sodium:solute symporter family protein [Siminovitchia terrae]RST57544.1 sodium:solute symporter family protein [Siminovitchia terrae]GIN90463.1 sodium:proline symporter [Siminovitchia terrae]